MASAGSCEINLSGLSKEDADIVKRQVKSIVDRAQAMADMTDIDEAVQKSLADYEQFLKAAATIQKRNAYLNKIKTKNIVDSILSNWNGDEAEGLIAFLVGSEKEVFGARNTVENAIQNYQNKYVGYVLSALQKEGLLDEFQSGVYDKDIIVARRKIDSGEPTTGINKQAIRMAEIIHNLNKLITKDANFHGAFIRELDGYVVHQSHDMAKIRADRAAWKAFMIDNNDWSTDFMDLDMKAIDSYLDDQWNEFASGVHINDSLQPDTSGLKGFASIAKRMSKSRVYHFKTPEAEYEYMKKFGHETLFDAVSWSAQSRGRAVGIMSKLGPNAEMNLANAKNEILKSLKKLRTADAPDRMAKLESRFNDRIMRSIWPNLTGAVSIPGSHIGALTEALILKTQTMSSLGASSWASLFGDPITSGFNTLMQERSVSSFIKGYGEYFSYFTKNIRRPEILDFLTDAGLQMDFMTLGFNPRFSETSAVFTKGQRRLTAMENLFFRMTGQAFLDGRGRTGNALGFAGRIGRRTDLSYDALDDGYKIVFSNNGIDAVDWELARKSFKQIDSHRVIDIEGIKSLSDADIEAYVKAKGYKVSKYNKQRATDELISKFRNMYQDNQSYSILAPGLRLRSFMYGGEKAGSNIGIARKLFWQFRGFPLSFVQKTYGRLVGSNAPMAFKMKATASIFMTTTIAAYLQMSIRDMLAGREPKELSGKVAYESILRGGGLGMFGDLAYQMYNEQFGQSALVAMLGPTAGDVGRLASSLGGALSGDAEKAQDNMAKFVTSNIPFSNVFWLKPALEYAFLNQMKELISPGSLMRTEQRMQQDYGQEYFMLRPSETMLFQ